jgi:hypothetical protein
MSDNLPFDDYVRQRLGEYSPEVPPHIWQQIEAGKEGKKPHGFWVSRNNRIWSLAAALLLLTGGAAYWATRKAPDSPANTVAGTRKATGTLPATLPNTGTRPGNETDPTVGNPIAGGTSGTASNDIPTDRQTTQGQLTQAQAADGQASNIQKAQGPTGTNDAATDNADGGLATHAGIQPTTKGGLRFGPSTTNRFVKAPHGRPNLPFKKVAAADDTGKADAEDETASMQPGTGNKAPNGSQAFTGLPNKLYGPAQLQFGNKANMGSLRMRGLTGLTVPDCPSIEDDAAGNKKYVEVYAGPDLGLSSFGSFQNDSSSNRYLQRRKETLRFSSAFSAGLRYTKVFKNGLSIRSGVNYSQINEKFRFVNERDIRYILVITPREVNVGGSTVTVFDTLRYTQTGTRVKTTYNRYRQIDIPLQLGYEFGNGRLHTNISAGAIVNLYSWQRGDMLDSALQPVSITTGKGSSAYGFKTNMGVGFLGSVSVYYKMTPRLHVLAEPYFRYNLQPMTRDNQSVTQKYSTLGLRLGVRWDLK